MLDNDCVLREPKGRVEQKYVLLNEKDIDASTRYCPRPKLTYRSRKELGTISLIHQCIPYPGQKNNSEKVYCVQYGFIRIPRYSKYPTQFALAALTPFFFNLHRKRKKKIKAHRCLRSVLTVPNDLPLRHVAGSKHL